MAMVGRGGNAAPLVPVLGDYNIKIFEMPVLLRSVDGDSMPAARIYVYIVHRKMLVAVEGYASHIV